MKTLKQFKDYLGITKRVANMMLKQNKNEDNLISIALIGNANRTLKDIKLVEKVLSTFENGKAYMNKSGTECALLIAKELSKKD